MRFVIAFAVLFFAAGGALARGQAVVERGFGDAAREWEVLVVKLHGAGVGGAVGASLVGVRDGRGGLRVWRPVEVTEGGESRVLLPLPLVAPGALPAEGWPIEVSVKSLAGDVTRETVEVQHGGGGGAGGEGTGTFRVMGTEGGEGLGVLNAGQVAYLGVGEEEILAGPMALFLACDAVVVSDRLAGRLTADRIAALLGNGVQLASRRDPARFGEGVLGRIGWVQVSTEGSGLWVTGRSGYPRARAVETGIEKIGTVTASASPTKMTLAGAMLAPAGGLVVAMLAWGLFRRRGLVLAAFFVGMAGLMTGTVVFLRGSAAPAERAVTWSCSDAGDPRRATTVAVTERIAGTSALFGEDMNVTAEEDQLLLPVCASTRQFFGMREAELWLDVLSEDGLRRVSRLEAPLRARQVLMYGLRTTTLTAGAVDLARGAWIEGGYVRQAGGEAAAPVLLTRWAAEHEAVRDSLLAWYELRFAASRRYFLSEGGGVLLADMGTPAATRP